MTPDRLLDTAIRQFGSKGLDGASTRAIAAEAGTAMSAITYHYGGKEGLYLAAADRIAAMMAERLGEKLGQDAEIGDDDPAAARDGVVRILTRMADAMASPDTAAWSPFIVREQMHPTAAFERIYAGGMGTLAETLARLVRIATGAPPREACMTAMTLIGQPIALRASRATFLRLLEREQFDAEDVASIRARIAANTHAILDRLTAEARDIA